jgi:predicted Zn-dependent protease
MIRILIFYLVLAGSALAAVTSLDLPEMGDSTGTILSPEFERRLGQAFLSQVRREANIINDPEIETYIRSLGYRLVSHSDRNTQTFTFFVINDTMINAFAAPGGIVGINSGTILNADNESELAGVMAHEIVHVTQKHMARSVEMQQQMSIPMMAAMLGAILLATQSPDAGQAAIMAIQGGAAQAQINFTRSNEQEADRVGMQLLARSGFNPGGMFGFFEKLQKNSRYFGQAPEFLRTHPLTVNRIADARARSDSLPRDLEYDESKSFPYIKAKLTVMSYKDPRQAIKLFRSRLDDENHIRDFIPNRYGYALALMEAGDYEQATPHLRALLAREPENVSFMLAAADLESRKRNFRKSFGIYEEALHIYPDYRPIVLAYTETLLQANQPELARDLLKNYGKFNEPDLTYYEYLARSEAEAGNPVESGIATAEHYYLAGETQVAILQISSLLQQKDPKPDYYQEERLQDRLAFLQRELKIEQDMKLRK